MDTLVTTVVVLAMIAITAYVIHLLNARHRHHRLRPAHYDHGLAGFDDAPAPEQGTGSLPSATSRRSSAPPPP
ncbi:hypothetical protein ACFVWY_23390 [Streptomyces sp. NPDC058195]|uniref:hypothetical protein n=1 Tax=Streptomyces sp. NPDC058195 TaxID=3346375 RepID=UPI0036E5BD2B